MNKILNISFLIEDVGIERELKIFSDSDLCLVQGKDFLTIEFSNGAGHTEQEILSDPSSGSFHISLSCKEVDCLIKALRCIQDKQS